MNGVVQVVLVAVLVICCGEIRARAHIHYQHLGVASTASSTPTPGHLLAVATGSVGMSRACNSWSVTPRHGRAFAKFWKHDRLNSVRPSRDILGASWSRAGLLVVTLAPSSNPWARHLESTGRASCCHCGAQGWCHPSRRRVSG